jgi:hypothetical protein
VAGVRSSVAGVYVSDVKAERVSVPVRLMALSIRCDSAAVVNHSWQLAVSSWPLAVGSWQLEDDGRCL